MGISSVVKRVEIAAACDVFNRVMQNRSLWVVQQVDVVWFPTHVYRSIVRSPQKDML